MIWQRPKVKHGRCMKISHSKNISSQASKDIGLINHAAHAMCLNLNIPKSKAVSYVDTKRSNRGLLSPPCYCLLLHGPKQHLNSQVQIPEAKNFSMSSHRSQAMKERYYNLDHIYNPAFKKSIIRVWSEMTWQIFKFQVEILLASHNECIFFGLGKICKELNSIRFKILFAFASDHSKRQAIKYLICCTPEEHW